MKWTWSDEDTNRGKKLLEHAFDTGQYEDLIDFFDWVEDNLPVHMDTVEYIFTKVHRKKYREWALSLYHQSLIPPNNNPIPGNLNYLLYNYETGVVFLLVVVVIGAYYLFR